MKPTGIREFNYFCRHVNSQGFDSVVGVSGPEQSGKSSFSLACTTQSKKTKSVDDIKKLFENNFIFRPTENEVEKVKSLPHNDDVVIDEAIRIAWRREWYRPENRWILKLFRQIGLFHRRYFLNIPKFWSMDDEYLNDRVNIWVHVIKKDVEVIDGVSRPTKFHAVIFEKDYHAYQDDPWMKRACRKIMKEDIQRRGRVRLVGDSVEKILKRYTTLPTFWGYISFKPIKDELWKEYKVFSQKSKMDTQITTKPDHNKWKIRLYAILNNMVDRGMTTGSIMEYFKNNGNDLVTRQWLSKQLNDIEDVLSNESVMRNYKRKKFS